MKTLDEFMTLVSEADSISGFDILQDDPLIVQAMNGNQLIFSKWKDGYVLSIMSHANGDKVNMFKMPSAVYKQIYKRLKP